MIKTILALSIATTTITATAGQNNIQDQLQEEYYNSITYAPITMDRHNEIMKHTNEKVSILETSISNLNEELKKLLSASRQITKTNEKLISTMDVYEQKNTTLSTDILNKNKEITQLTTLIRNLEDENKQQQQKIVVLSQELIESKLFKDKYNITLQMLDKSIKHSKHLETKIEALTKLVDRTKQEIVEIINNKKQVVKKEIIQNTPVNTLVPQERVKINMGIEPANKAIKKPTNKLGVFRINKQLTKTVINEKIADIEKDNPNLEIVDMELSKNNKIVITTEKKIK